MDHITIEKFLAMKKFKKNQYYILHKFILYSLAAVGCILFCISPSWVFSLSSSIKLFLNVSLPNLGASIFNPKCLFIVCNIIVVILIGESKFLGSKSPPAAATDVYDEYAKRSTTSIQNSSPSTTTTTTAAAATRQKDKKEKNKMNNMKLELHLIDDSSRRRVVKEERVEEDFDGEEEEECFLGGEELKKRVENFIERVKKQRKLETGQDIFSYQ